MKIAIAGYGSEGESNFKYYSKDASNEIVIFDEKQPERTIPSGIKSLIGSGVFEKLDGFDLVVRTAGLAPRKIKTNGKIWSATNEFFAKCPCKIIGVTGSKGKGTTASFVASILEAAGQKVWLIGNIGKPALDVLGDIQSDDIVVYELSSFQLWDLEKSPQIGVVLFIEQEHLDVHENMQEYVNAKANIAIHQTSRDLLIYNRFNKYSLEIASKSKAKLIGYPYETTAHIKDQAFYYGEQKICSINAVNLVGKHNYDNACAAIDAIWDLINGDITAIEKGLSDFKGLPHRLQFVAEVDRVRYYDDSIATTPSSAIAALKSFDDPKIIILGGSSKGSDFSELASELLAHDVNAILIGDEASTIAKACDAKGFNKYEIISSATMPDIVKRASELASGNGVVLLSPASASFGLFKNYVDRGDQFAAAVRNL